MKFMFPLTLATIVSTLFITSSPLRAADMDDRIESSATKSYMFKTYLKDDSIKTESKDGIVTLTGTVADSSHKSMAENTGGRLARRQKREQRACDQRRTAGGTFRRLTHHES